MDYGLLLTLGLVWFKFNEEKYQVNKYKITELTSDNNYLELTNMGQTLTLCKGKMEFTLNKLEKIK